MVVDAGSDRADRSPGGPKTAGETTPGNSGSGAPEGGGPDLQKLAQDWITLWQSELSAMAADTEMHEAWQATMTLWVRTIASTLRSTAWTRASGAYDRAGRQAGTAEASRTPPADVAPDPRDAEIERLAGHVAALERRLADLERGGDPAVAPKRRATRKPRK